MVARRRLVPIVLAITAVGLVLAAISPNIGLLIGVCVLVGLGSVAAQMLVPLAASLADESNRGAVVGKVMSGLLIGILLARTLAGLVADVAGWRIGVLRSRRPGSWRWRSCCRSTPARRDPSKDALLSGTVALGGRVVPRRADAPPAGPVRRTGLRRVQRLLDDGRLRARRSALSLQRDGHRAIRPRRRCGRDLCQRGRAGSPTAASWRTSRVRAQCCCSSVSACSTSGATRSGR